MFHVLFLAVEIATAILFSPRVLSYQCWCCWENGVREMFMSNSNQKNHSVMFYNKLDLKFISANLPKNLTVCQFAQWPRRGGVGLDHFLPNFFVYFCFLSVVYDTL